MNKEFGKTTINLITTINMQRQQSLLMRIDGLPSCMFVVHEQMLNGFHKLITPNTNYNLRNQDKKVQINLISLSKVARKQKLM